LADGAWEVGGWNEIPLPELVPLCRRLDIFQWVFSLQGREATQHDTAMKDWRNLYCVDSIYLLLPARSIACVQNLNLAIAAP
jgi:hypothetical protein